MKWFLKATLIWAAIASAVAALVISLGLYNVSARQDHLPGVTWILHTTYRNAVRLRAPAPEKLPPLNDNDLVALGQEHYEVACVFCHARPNKPRSQTALSMLPAPPPISQAIEDWEANHLFWIVKNGVKMSGMPAWPSDKRDDDVWAVVAFLESIRQTATVLPTPESQDEPADIAETGFKQKCATCHAADGRANGNKHIPRLDTLTKEYVEASLKAYRNGDRQSGIMQQAASQLDDTEINTFAAFIGDLDTRQSAIINTPDTAAIIQQGKELANFGNPKKRVPACSSCHGPKASEKSVFYPQLASQRRSYIEQQLKLFKAGKRGGTQRQNLMHIAVEGLTNNDISALSAYFASLSPSPAQPAK